MVQLHNGVVGEIRFFIASIPSVAVFSPFALTSKMENKIYEGRRTETLSSCLVKDIYRKCVLIEFESKLYVSTMPNIWEKD